MMAIIIYVFDRETCEIMHTRILTTSEVAMMCGDSTSMSTSHLNLHARLQSGVLLLPFSKMIKSPPDQVFDDIYSTALGISSPKGSVLEAIYLASMWGFRPCVDALMSGLTKKLPDYIKYDPMKWLILLLMVSYFHNWMVDPIYLQIVCADVYDFISDVYGFIDIEFALRQPCVAQRFEAVHKCARDDVAYIEQYNIDGFRVYAKSILSKIDIGMLVHRCRDTCCSTNTDISDVCSVSNDTIIDTATIVR